MALVTPIARPRFAAALPLLVTLSVCTFSANACAEEIIDEGYAPEYSMDSCGTGCSTATAAAVVECGSAPTIFAGDLMAAATYRH